MIEKINSLFSRKCNLYLLLALAITFGLLVYTQYKIGCQYKKIDEIEYKDSTNKFNKLYYESSINELKQKNKELYDSLKDSKDRISYLTQFTAKQKYNTGKVIIKEVHDTVSVDSIKTPKTFEYTNVTKNDTMEYKLKINSTEEPNWYSLDITTTNKYTIVNKEYENGMNHVTIDGGTTAEITDVTVFKKKNKRKFLDRFSVGPSVIAGYDPINKRFGVVVGGGVTFDLK